MNEREIFAEAMQISSAEERLAFLDRACADDAALRKRVSGLLDEQEKLGSFLEIPAAAVATVERPVSERVGMLIGPYKLLQQIGEGGMGVVYMAEQSEPVKRRVALKIIKPGMDTRQVIARFEAERQALSLMDHPNIAKVLDAGATESGRPYFVMELVKGQPITQYCDEHHLTPRQRLELLLPVCQAIQHAHQKGIIHRDIKPTNILVAEYDQQPVPKVIDFGVAKATSQALTEKTMFTGLGQIVGTLEYMSPEQAKVNQLDIDTRSDIYSLGVLLYELLTGSTPFDRKRLRSAAFDEMLRIIREEEPPKPSTRLSDLSTPHAPREESGTRSELPTLASIAAQRHTDPAKLTKLVRGELDWIVMKCLEKDRNRRYETANGLAMDMQRYLNDEPVQACPPSAWYRCRKFVRRNKRGLLVMGVVFLALTGGIFGVWNRILANRSRVIAEEKEKEALTASLNEKHESLLRQMQLSRTATHVAATRVEGWSKRAWSLVTDASQIRPDAQLRSEAAATLAQIDARLEKNLQPLAGSSVAFSPDGRQILVGGARGTGYYQARGAELYDSQNYHRRPSSSPVGFGIVGFRGENAVQLVTGQGAELKLWNVGANKAIREFRFAVGKDAVNVSDLVQNDHGAAVAALSANARLVAAAAKRTDGSPIVTVWDGASGKQQFSQSASASALAFSTDGRKLAVGNHQGQAAVWSVLDGKLLTSFRAGRGTVNCLAFSSDDRRLAVGGADGLLAIWDWEATMHVTNCRASTYDVYAVAFSPDGVTLASGGRDRGYLWDVATGRPLLDLGTRDFVTGLAFSPNGRRLACSSLGGFDEGGVYVWELDEDRGIQTLRGLDTQVVRLWYSQDGKALAALSQNWRIGVWNLASSRLLHVLDAPRGVYADNAGLAFSPDGNHIAFSTSGQAQMWDVATGDTVRRWTLPAGLQDTLAFDPSGKLLLFREETRDKEAGTLSNAPRSEHPRVVRIRDLLDPESAEGLPEISVFPYRAFPVLAPRDGTFVVVRGQSSANDKLRTVKAFDSLTGKELWTHTWDADIEVHLDPVGKVLSISMPGDKTMFYDPQSGKELFPADPPGVSGIGDEGRWLTRDRAGGFALFRRGTKEAIVNLSLDQNAWDVRFSDDGNLVAAGHPDGSVSVHNLSEIQKRLASVGLGWKL